MTQQQTCHCGTPTAGAWLCDRCVKTLEVAFVNVPAYYGDLDTLRRKQTRYGDGGRSGIGKAQPLIVDGRFTDRTGDGSRIDDETRNTVTTWCRMVMDEQPQMAGPYCRTACLHTSCAALFRKRYPRDTVQSMGAYLLRQLRWIIREEWAEEILDEFTDLENRLRRIVDRPAEKWYAGKCSSEVDVDGETVTCAADLYARSERGFMDCGACGTRHDVSKRRDFLLREAREVSVTATEAAGALMAWTDYDGSLEKLTDRIRKWRDRDQLSTHGSIRVSGQMRDLFRLGDIEVLLMRKANDTRMRHMNGAA